VPKVEKLIDKSKRTTPQPCFGNFLIFQISIIAFVKTLLTAKRRKTIYVKGENLFRVGFYLAKRKAFEKGGESLNLGKYF
jgi:hypothetical protein